MGPGAGGRPGGFGSLETRVPGDAGAYTALARNSSGRSRVRPVTAGTMWVDTEYDGVRAHQFEIRGER